MTVRAIAIMGLVLAGLYLSFYRFPTGADEVVLFMIVHVIAFLATTLTALRLRSSQTADHRKMCWMIMAFGILYRLSLVFHPPVASDDIYRYVWDGKVAASGINPFAFAPNDPSLQHLHTHLLPSHINHPTMRTIYPPFAQVFFLFAHLLFGDGLEGWKLLIVLADVATLLILFGLFRCAPSSLVLYAWSPLPILYFGLDGHIDALGIAFLLCALALFRRKRALVGAVMLGLSVLAKLYPLAVVPLISQLKKGWRRFALPALCLAVVLIGYMLYWEPTGGLFESLTTFNMRFAFNGSLFHIVFPLIGSNEAAHLVCAGLFVLWWVGVAALERPLIEKVFLVFLGFIVCSPTVHPWYLVWLAALVPLRWSPATFVLLGLSVVSNWTVYRFRSSGVWEESVVLLLVEYVPFVVVLVYEVWKRKPLPSMVRLSEQS